MVIRFAFSVSPQEAMTMECPQGVEVSEHQQADEKSQNSQQNNPQMRGLDSPPTIVTVRMIVDGKVCIYNLN